MKHDPVGPRMMGNYVVRRRSAVTVAVNRYLVGTDGIGRFAGSATTRTP